MRKRLLATLLAFALLLALALAPAATAVTTDGRGLYGATDDPAVTNAAFILIIFFPLFIFLMSMLQRTLEKRKEARKAAHSSQLGDAHWRGGW
jgi:ABC-type nickel/cobalt efflux system permease component RcnA